jgi:hypothetical protein
MQGAREERGTDDFKRAADNLAMMLNITQQLRTNQEGSPATGFWDALGALFSNRDFAGSIAQTVRARAEEQQKAQLTAQQKQLALQQRALLIAQQQQLAAEANRALNQGSQVVNGGTVAAPPSVAPPPAAAADKPKLRVVPKKKVEPLPPLPANTVDHLNAIQNATDDADRLKHLVNLLLYFAPFAEWRPFSEELMGLAQQGKKRESMQFLAAFLERFVHANLMTEETAKALLNAVLQNFDLIHAQLSQGASSPEEIIGEDPEKAQEPPDFLEAIDEITEAPPE